MSEKSHKHISCEHCGVRREGLFNNLLPGEVDDLNNHKICNLFKKNQSIFLEGSFPRGVYCLNRGKVKVYTIGDEGKEQIIHVAKEGEILGFRAMFSGDPYKVSAATLEDSSICFIGKEDFLNMIDTNAALRNTIMKELSKELGDRAQFITNLSQKSVRERLAFTLVLLQKVYGEEPVNMSREDLANFVGTATETLIRLLKDFKEEGFIEVHTRKITILNREALVRLGGAVK
ncbi:MAG: transcriptional regulator [Candidatus Fluviicola riflensis]|nr:MAG: transcriptional regulator [Candidatus Fluviicola riflensis]OGS79206.1 MAG: transcriptional regulator [Candidatus Fluviicola riflensis]OGS86638.1 MAG: transcriptional regulator [Fluviicola sp. RIFCSPHIGHO2_01_FULL_43_53]OGS88888.1 MAG: transcriptional regulator [Fluviicola sp. RIFCSPHIGHO2_12_FULL_43_24]